MSMITVFAVWYAIGLALLVYLWTRKYDLSGYNALVILHAAVFGPIAGLVAFFLTYEGQLLSRVLIKKRTLEIEEN